MTVPITLTELSARWQRAWPHALAAWSRHVVLRAPLLCLEREHAAREGLLESFAMIRLQDQAVVIDLADIHRRGLADYAVEILAHEIGHHVLAPANLTDHARALARVRRALPTLEVHAPMIANLYTDLLINDRLQRSAGLRLDAVFKRLAAEGSSNDPLWSLYLRAYELLWSLPRGELGAAELSAEVEGDAWLAMRLVRHYARNWIEGAAKFAMLVLPHLAQRADAKHTWHDTLAAGAGGQPSGLAEAEEEQPLVHPARDAQLTGTEVSEPATTVAMDPRATSRARGGGQARQPFEYGEILRAAGVTLSDAELAVLYYREKAAPHLVRFPASRQPRSIDPLPEGLAPWDVGESFETIDWLQSVLQSPRIIPGLTTVQRLWGDSEAAKPASVPLDLDVYIDSSGSMPNPQQMLSYPTLAGAILCLSALRAGASVQITVWAGKHEVSSTPGFVRDTQQVMRALLSYFGGGTQFPLPTLRQTYLEKRRRRATHLLVISDDGVTTLFDADERGNAGWDVLRGALAAAQGGATFVLNLTADWDQPQRDFYKRAELLRARSELGVTVYRVDDWLQLVDFAREFSQRVYRLSETA